VAEDPSRFVSRWSQRKLEQRQGRGTDTVSEENGAAALVTAAPADPAVPADPATPTEPPAGQPDAAVLDLPNIEDLTAESDFTPFMREGVPDDLQRLALRKLWRLTPGIRDGLDDYDEDFSLIGMVAEKISTLFKPGQGMRTPEDAVGASKQAEASDDSESPGETDATRTTDVAALQADDAEAATPAERSSAASSNPAPDLATDDADVGDGEDDDI